MKPLICIASIFIVHFLHAQAPVVINTKPQKVIVYLSGAEINFNENVKLKQGENVIQFKGLASSLITGSVQVATDSDVELISVSTQSEHLFPYQVNSSLRLKRDSIMAWEEQRTIIDNQIDAYQMEKQTLLQNQHLNGTSSVLLQDLAKAADFFRERTLKINNALTLLNKKRAVITDRIAIAKNEYKTESDNTDTTRVLLEVIVLSKEAKSVNFSVRYLVEQAQWQASYDIVSTEINQPVMLKYKAQVYNNTGIDWKEVTLALSTGDISISASRPYLTAWTLNYNSTGNEGYTSLTAQNNLPKKEESTVEERVVSELNTTFAVEQKHSIKADGNPYHIQLAKEMLAASYEYLTVPKVEMSAFLIAKVVGWEKLNLIDGSANVYYKSTYIGESAINTQLIGDTLELSLGRDNQVVVNRSKVEDKGSTPTIGAKRSESFVYEIQLRNNKATPISIKVQDQVPISQESDISVEVTDISGASHDIASGRLQWLRTLQAGQTEKYRIAFTVKYPKNKTVNIRKSRVVRTPRFKH